MKKRNISNLVLGTALVSVAAYVAYRIYKKKKAEENRKELVLRNYTVIGTHDFSNKQDDEVEAKVM